MKFTSSRKILIAAMGHAVWFEKGDTHFLPPALHQVALEQGLEALPDDGETAPVRAPATDDTARVEAIKAAMRAIAEKNNPDDFDAGGTPKVRAIENLTGGMKPTDAKERAALWAEVINSTEA